MWLDQQILVGHGCLSKVGYVRDVWDIRLEIAHEIVRLVQDVDRGRGLPVVADDRVGLTASRLHLLLGCHVAVVAGKATMVEAHELLLADAVVELVAAVREAAHVVGVVQELLMRLLRGHLLRLLLLGGLSQELLVELAAHLLRRVLRLATLLLLVHQLVYLEQSLGRSCVLLLLCLRAALTASDLWVVEASWVSSVDHHQVTGAAALSVRDRDAWCQGALCLPSDELSLVLLMLALRAGRVRSERAPHADAGSAATTLLPARCNLRSAASALHLKLLLLVLLLVLGLLLLAPEGIAGSTAWLLHLLNLLECPMGVPNVCAGTCCSHRLVVEIRWYLLGELLLHL